MSTFIYELWSNICSKVIREGDIGKKLFPDFPGMKVDFAEIGIGKIGLGPLPPVLDRIMCKGTYSSMYHGAESSTYRLA